MSVILCRKKAEHVELLLGKNPVAKRSSLLPCSGGTEYLTETILAGSVASKSKVAGAKNAEW